MQMMDLIHPDDRQRTEQAVCEVMAGTPQPHFRNRYPHKNGTTVDMQWSATWLPECAIRIAVGHDVTQLRTTERRLEHLASHDSLTGLLNRHQLMLELEAAIARAAAGSGGLSLLFIDLDGFKAANDLHGHEFGDRLLQQTAQRLHAGLRQGDLIARVGGDEFVAVLPGCARRADAEAVAESLRALLNRTASSNEGNAIDISIGAACYPADGTTADALLRTADDRMYAVKAGRRRSRTEHSPALIMQRARGTAGGHPLPGHVCCCTSAVWRQPSDAGTAESRTRATASDAASVPYRLLMVAYLW